MMMEPDPKTGRDTSSDAPTVLDIMRRALDSREVEYDEPDGPTEFLAARIPLEHVDVNLVCWGEREDMATVCVTFPVRVPEEARPAVAEFLLRANYSARRAIWEMDCSDGEVRLRVYADTMFSEFCEDHFLAMLAFLLKVADVFFPFLSAVMTRAMKPETALEQAEAAFEVD